MSKMFFDIRGKTKALESLSNMIGQEKDRVAQFLAFENINDGDDLLNRFNMTISDFDISDIEIVVSHITTSIDDMKSLYKFGLMPLKEVLTKNTSINSFLKEHDILFDFENKYIKVGNKEYSVDYEKISCQEICDEIQDSLERIAYKMYCDRQICAFMCVESIESYAANVHEGSEFLRILSRITDNDILFAEWKNLAKTSVIDFCVKLTELNYRELYPDEYFFMVDQKERIYLKRKLLKLAMEVIRYSGIKPEIRVELLEDVVIESSRFLSVGTEIE